MNWSPTRKIHFGTAERGAVAALAAVLIILFLTVGAGVLGVSVYTSTRVKLDQVAASTAFAALDAYNRASGSRSERLSVAKERVESLLAQNRIPFSAAVGWDTVALQSEQFDNTNVNSQILTGQWIPKQPIEGSGDPCTGDYPCFLSSTQLDSSTSSTESEINAVRVRLNLRGTSFIAPLLTFIGTPSQSLGSSEQTAAYTPRCVLFVTDASSSVTYETHVKLPNSERITLHNNYDALSTTSEYIKRGKFYYSNSEYQQWYSRFQNLATSSLAWNTNPLLEFSGFESPEVQYPGTHPKFRIPGQHYLGDYEFVTLAATHPAVAGDTSNDGLTGIWVDRFSGSNAKNTNGPEPFLTYFRAINAGLRKMMAEKIPGDRAGLMAFHSDVVSFTGISEDFEGLLQLTNLNNRGLGTRSFNGMPNSVGSWNPDAVATEVRPNFLDWGWFPWDSGSNLKAGLDAAAFYMSDPAICPANARRILVLASDGIANCVGTEENDWGVTLENTAPGMAGSVDPIPTFCRHNSNLSLEQDDTGDSNHCGDNNRGFCIPRHKCLNKVGGTYTRKTSVCHNSFATYRLAERQILAWPEFRSRSSGAGTDTVTPPIKPSYTYNWADEAGATASGALKKLVDAGVTISVMVKADYIDPNWTLWKKPDGKDIYLPEEAGRAGFTGVPQIWDPAKCWYNAGDTDCAAKGQFVHWSEQGFGGQRGWRFVETIDTYLGVEYAGGANPFRTMQTPTAARPFRRANALLVELPLRTGGYWCPLLPVAPAENYEENPADPTGPRTFNKELLLSYALPTSHRMYFTANGPLSNSWPGGFGQPPATFRYAYTERDPIEQAFDCVGKSLETNPYTLVTR